MSRACEAVRIQGIQGRRTVLQRAVTWALKIPTCSVEEGEMVKCISKAKGSVLGKDHGGTKPASNTDNVPNHSSATWHMGHQHVGVSHAREFQ